MNTLSINLPMSLFFALLGSGFQIVAYITYLLTIFRGKTKPHLYTWLLWGTLGAIITTIQITNDAGWSIMISGLMSICNLSIAGLALKYGETRLSLRDKYLLALAGITIILWQTTDNDLMAVILVCLIDAIAFFYTFKKSYHKPFDENINSYVLWTLQLGSFALAVQNPSLTTLLYPVFLTIMELTFVLFLFWRRKVSRIV